MPVVFELHHRAGDRNAALLFNFHPVRRRVACALAALDRAGQLIAPPNSSSFSVSVVLPASGWEMIAKVWRLATSRRISGGNGVEGVAEVAFESGVELIECAFDGERTERREVIPKKRSGHATQWHVVRVPHD